jgi:CBS domain-containing protein
MLRRTPGGGEIRMAHARTDTRAATRNMPVARQVPERRVHHVAVMRGQALEGVISVLDFVRRFLAENPAWAGCCRRAL